MRTIYLRFKKELKQNPFGTIFGLLSLIGLSLFMVLEALFKAFGWWLSLVYLPALLGFLYWKLGRDRCTLGRLMESGIQDYYPEYQATFSCRYWETTSATYRYLGITGSTFLSQLKTWMNTGGKDLSYEFLLLDKNSKYYQRFEAARLFPGVATLSPEQEAAVNQHTETKRQAFDCTVATLHSTIPAQNHRVRIKTYDSYPSYWIEILDNHTILMGLLSSRRPGAQSPLVVLVPKGDFSLYHSVHDQWDRLWQQGIDHP
jgi:hypothetical protein